MALFGFLESNYYLTLDRTNWQWGKRNINILVLAVVYKGVAIPIYWLMLNKKGMSSTRERIALLNRFIKQFGQNRIIKLLADREFVGKDWFDWLKSQKIDFAIRIKKSYLSTNRQGQVVPVKTLFRMLPVGETQILLGERKLFDTTVFLSALRLADGELLIVATATSGCDAIESYALRWEIETLFGCLKSKGFNFEDTHIVDRARIKRLMIVLVIAFCWAHRVGEWQHSQVKPIIIKKHQRLAKSIFRVGLDKVNEVLFSLFFHEKTTGNIVELFGFLCVKKRD